MTTASAGTELVSRWISKKVTTGKYLLLLNTLATIFGIPVLMKNVGHKAIGPLMVSFV